MTEKILSHFNQNKKIKIKPIDASSPPKSWNSSPTNDKNLLTTEQKIFAISNGITCDIEAAVVKKNSCKLKEFIEKWTKKCPWHLPWVMISFSAIQVNFFSQFFVYLKKVCLKIRKKNSINFSQLIFNIFTPIDKTYQLLAFSSMHTSEVWRFFTYSLLHAGSAHLIINIILQLFIALPLETEVGHFRVFFVYFGGVFSGSLAASMNNDGWLMVGASSGIYSLLMSHLSHIYLVSWFIWVKFLCLAKFCRNSIIFFLNQNF